MKFDPLTLLTWTPLQHIAIAEREYGDKLGLHTYHSKWGVGQLMYLDLDWSEIDRSIDFERMNWDGNFGMDFATLASILCTNKVACRSWKEVAQILEVYQRNWKTRFLVSLFCTGLSKVGNFGMPLYYSELVGYRVGVLYKEGLLDVTNESPENGINWMILRIMEKMSDSDARMQLLKILSSNQRNLVYPFLLNGSKAIASYRKLEKLGGKDKVISKAVPKEVTDEVYMMLISTTSRLFDFGPKPKLFTYDDLFSKIQVKEVVLFGADTTIRTSPLFEALRAELGHLCFPRSGELGDALSRYAPQFGVEDRELTFDRATDSSPPEMPIALSLHAQQKKQENSHWTINPEWLKKLRTEDL